MVWGVFSRQVTTSLIGLSLILGVWPMHSYAQLRRYVALLLVVLIVFEIPLAHGLDSKKSKLVEEEAKKTGVK
jgi:hypothetical protein